MQNLSINSFNPMINQLFLMNIFQNQSKQKLNENEKENIKTKKKQNNE
jgi:hypothetical protein